MQPQVQVGEQQNLQQYFSQSITIAKKSVDTTVLLMTIFALGLFMLTVILLTDIRALAVFVGLIIFGFIKIKMQQRRVVANGISIMATRHYNVQSLLQEISKNLQSPPIELYVTDDMDTRRIETLGSGKRFLILLDDSLLSDMNDAELRILLTREVAMIVFGSAPLLSFVRRFSEAFSFFGIGSFIESMFGFWSRRAITSADRLAVLYTRDPVGVMKALIKLDIGATIAETVSVSAVLQQKQLQSGFSRWLVQLSSEQPLLTERLHAALLFANEAQVPFRLDQ
jgi:Zn-dependent protease with chaperone function